MSQQQAKPIQQQQPNNSAVQSQQPGASQPQPQFDSQTPQGMPDQQTQQQQMLDPSQQQMVSQQYVQQQMAAPQQQMMQQQQQPMQMQQNAGAVEYGSVNQRFKTQKCRHFDSKGFCQWNENCQYAHGDAELRDINDPIPDHMRTQASRRVVTGQRQMGSTPGGQQNQGGPSQGGPSQGGYNNNRGGGYSSGGSRGGGGYSRGGGDNYQSSGGYSGGGGRGGAHQNANGGGGYQPYNSGIQSGGNNYYQQNNGMSRGSSRGGMGSARGGSQMGGQIYGEDNDFQGVRRGGRGGSRGGGDQRGGGGQGGQGGYQGGQNNASQGGQNFKNHKTVICKHFSAGKTCPYQNNCTYAHGMLELRQAPPNQGGNQYGGGGQQVYQNKQQQPYMSPQQQIAMPAYHQAQPMYGGIIQQVPMPGQMGNPQIFGEPTIIYGEPNGAHQRYDQYPNNQGPYDQQQLLVNGQGNQSQGMIPMYTNAGVQQPGAMLMQQPMVAPVQTQIVINSTSDSPDGQTIQTQRVMTIFIMHNNQEVQEQIKMATGLSEQGNYEQALQILSSLHETGKIQMQETASQSFGDPQDLSYIQEQQQPQSDTGVNQASAEEQLK